MMHTRISPRGIAMIEAVVSMVVMSIMLVAALHTVGMSRLGQRANADQLRATSLASDLMAEILDKPYADPSGIAIWGPEVDEILVGRTAFDDVDDYDGHSSSPPRDRAGAVMPGLNSWKREVAVAYVNPQDLTKTSLIDTGVKRITVTVSRGAVPLIKLVALRTNATPR